MKCNYELFVAGDKDSCLTETLRSGGYRFPRQEKQTLRKKGDPILLGAARNAPQFHLFLP